MVGCCICKPALNHSLTPFFFSASSTSASSSLLGVFLIFWVFRMLVLVLFGGVREAVVDSISDFAAWGFWKVVSPGDICF